MQVEDGGAVLVEMDVGAPGVAMIRLNRPKLRNALTADVKSGLLEAIPSLVADPGVRCIVLTGTDGAFCSGGNLADTRERTAAAVRSRLLETHGWVRPLLEGETPVIAAVNGPAAGAGFSLAMLCDIVLLSDGAYFQAGFPAIGAVPDLALALTLPRAIGMPRARALLLTNRRVGAAEAVALGLAVACHPESGLEAEALRLAAGIAAGPRVSLGLTKSLLAQAFGSVGTYLETEAMAQAVAFGTADFAEGVEAFVSKRRPVFGRQN